METRLLYILEKDMNEELSKLLQSYNVSDVRLIILVELSPIEVSSMPMIYDLKEIRLRKVKEKVKSWLDTQLKNIDFELIVFEGKPSKNNPPNPLKEIKQLRVFVNYENDIRIVPFLKAFLEPEKITFFSINKIVNNYLSQRI